MRLPGRDVKKGNILNGTIFCKFTGLQFSDIRWIKTLEDRSRLSISEPWKQTRTYIHATGKPNICVRQNTWRIQIAVGGEIQHLHSEAATSCGNAGRCDRLQVTECS